MTRSVPAWPQRPTCSRALRLRLRLPAGPPHAVRQAVRLMCLGATLETAALVTIATTPGGTEAAARRAEPGLTAAQWHAAHGQLTADLIGASIVVVLWLGLAWFHRRGVDGARLLYVAFFALLSVGVLGTLVRHAAVLPPAALVTSVLGWAAALAAFVLIFTPQASAFYRREAPDVIPVTR